MDNPACQNVSKAGAEVRFVGHAGRMAKLPVFSRLIEAGLADAIGDNLGVNGAPFAYLLHAAHRA
jgi:hypothetical protein